MPGLGCVKTLANRYNSVARFTKILNPDLSLHLTSVHVERETICTVGPRRP